MKFSTHTSASLHQIKTAALAVGVFADGILSPAAETIDHASEGAIKALPSHEFSGKAGTTLVLRQLKGVSAQRIVLVGLGKQSDYTSKTLSTAEQAFASYCINAGLDEVVSTLASIDCKDTTLKSRARMAAMAAGQTSYRYTATKAANPDNDLKLTSYALWTSRGKAASEAEKGLREGQAIAHGVALARHLGDLPPNVCTPTYLGDTARKLAKEFKSLKAQVLDRKEIEALGMGSFLSVARGSDEPPVFIVLKHSGTSQKSSKKNASAPVVLVGKGITFDAGGISLKPAANMDEMKYDMCGAASVLGTMRTVAELELDHDVIALIPACENLPSGRANKPGDIVTSMAGKTIEILNTDAEGRLILCDALTYAERFKPRAVIDVATLTGACVVALGHIHTGLFSTDDQLAKALLTAGKEMNDTAWQMPLDEAYQDQLKSNFADIANIGGPPAGSVTAACFLSRFTESYSWAHLDIAGTAWRSGKDKGASGRPVPLLANYLLNLN